MVVVGLLAAVAFRHIVAPPPMAPLRTAALLAAAPAVPGLRTVVRRKAVEHRRLCTGRRRMAAAGWGAGAGALVWAERLHMAGRRMAVVLVASAAMGLPLTAGRPCMAAAQEGERAWTRWVLQRVH